MLVLSGLELVRPTILIVDDEKEELRVLTELLRRQQYHVNIATDGKSGYQSALAQRPDLILLDVCMPELDGFATCRLLKADPLTCTIPIIFLSALDEPDDRVAGLAIGGVDFVAKPYLPAEVFARVRIHLELAGRRRQPPAISDDTPQHHPDAVLARAAMRLIDECVGMQMSLAGIAHALGTYDKRLSQAFRQYVGMTVFGYLAEARMARAKQLLTDTDMSMQQIAEHTGFRSAANFATAFRERMEVTPTAFRQASRQAALMP